MKLPAHKTKIVCTIGPSSESPEVMEKLILAGMNIARLNFSHGDFEKHKEVIRTCRSASRSIGKRVSIMADLPGPKMRIGRIANEPVELKPGDAFTLTTDDIPGDARRVSMTFQQLPQTVKTGDTLFLNDGLIQLEVRKVQKNDVTCTVLAGGELRSRKGLNLPGINLGISAFTPRDHECLRFAAEQGLDAVSQSFVETGDDVRTVRKVAGELGYYPLIIAKIERSNALDHLDDILDSADGIMIARGDLGVEIPIEQIAMIQKELAGKANILGKPVIIATQMLESMTNNRRPTRAEATDVANAILDGADCVMLSEESAMGRYPVESAEMLAKIAAASEPHRSRYSTAQKLPDSNASRIADVIASSVEAILKHISPAAVFIPTIGGATARSLARFRTPVWIVAVSTQEATCQKLQFTSGVYPVCYPERPDDWKPYITAWLRDHAIEGDLVILTEGPSAKQPEANNRLEIIDLKSVR
jgi:pyruvate kinase